MTEQLVVLKIQAILGGKSDMTDLQMRSLAAEYKRMRDAAAEKLERCAALIKAGRDYTALQVAETPPQLLETLNALSFPEYGKWVNFCRSEGYPAGAPFDEYQIELINGLYAKHISQTHPLYRDFRRAMRLRHTEEALSVIRTICKINANDAQAKLECEKIEKKFARMKEAELKHALEKRDDEKIVSLYSELKNYEHSYLKGSTVLETAKEAFSEHQAKASKKRMADIAGKLRMMGGDDFDGILSLASEYQMLKSANPEESSPEDAEYVDVRAAEAAKAHDAAEKDQEAQRARNELLMEIENPSAGGTQKERLKRITNLLDKSKDAIDNELQKKALKAASKLKGQIFRKRLYRLAIAVFAVAALGAAGYFMRLENIKAKSISDASMLIASADDMRDLNSAIKVAEEAEKTYAGAISKNQSLAIDLQKLKIELKTYSDKLTQIRQRMEDMDKFDFEKSSSSACQNAWNMLAETEGLAADFSARFEFPLDKALSDLRTKFSAAIDARKARIRKQLDTCLENIERYLSKLENPTADYPIIISEMTGEVMKAKPIAEDGTNLFKLHAIDTDRFNAAAARVDEAKRRMEEFERLHKAMADAKGELEYLSALQKFADSPASGETLKGKAKAILDRSESLRNGAYDGICSLEAGNASKDVKDFFRAPAAVKDEYLTNIYRYLRGGKPVYTLGKVEEKQTKWNGGSEVVQSAREIGYGAKINNTVYRLIMLGGKQPKGDILVSESITPESILGKEVEKISANIPALGLIKIIADFDKANPLYKLRLENAVFEEMRKDPIKSGLAYSPSAMAREKKIAKFAADNESKCGWLFDSQSKANLAAAELYSSPLPDYLKEAKINLAAAKELSASPMKMIGYADFDGKKKFFDDGENMEIWGITQDTGRFEKVMSGGVEKSAPAMFTPLMLETVSKENALKKARENADKNS